MSELTPLAKPLKLDPATIEFCIALLEFRALGTSSLGHSPKVRALRDAANDMRSLLLERESQRPSGAKL